MRILVPMFSIQDYGGITSHIEYMIRGLAEADHQVELVLLKNTDIPPYVKQFEAPGRSYGSLTGGNVHLMKGWYGVEVMSYGTAQRAKDFVNHASEYDYVIWGLPCPYADEGHWRELFTSGVPQVAVIHDAHYERAYGHFKDVADYLRFVAPVNESALGALKKFPGEVRLINNGHELQDWSKQKPWEARSRSAICAHVWKGWKRMDKVVRATPFLTRSDMVMAGDGIEGRYMRSKEKCRHQYNGIWQEFLNAGGSYLGILTPDQLMDQYANGRVMVDLSWNDKFAAYGCHYNRSIVEGANYGCVPLVCWETFKNTEIFKEGDYIPVQAVWAKSSAAEIADAIDAAANLHPVDAECCLDMLRRILQKHFDYRVNSLRYLY